MSPFIIYFIGIANKVAGLFAACIFITLVYTLIRCMCKGSDYEAAHGAEAEAAILREVYRIIHRGLVCAVIFALAFAVTPSGKTLAAMYIIPKIVNNENIQDEAKEIYILAKDWMKKELSEHQGD